MNDVSQKELYRIFNNIFSENSFWKYEGMDREISLFSQRAEEKWQKNPQLDMFEELSASPGEIKNVSDFCNTLKTYYSEIDKDSYTDDSLPESFYHRMYVELERCKTYVSEENKEKYNTMKRDIQKYLPEFRSKIIVEDYIEEAEKICKIRQKAQRIREKEKQESQKNYCERLAEHFYNEIKSDKELRNMEFHPNMLVLCEKCLPVIDCLPAKKFGRIKKFGIKMAIYKSMITIAKKLGGAYDKVANMAQKEIEKFQNAKRTTLEHAQKPLSSEEEWNYR